MRPLNSREHAFAEWFAKYFDGADVSHLIASSPQPTVERRVAKTREREQFGRASLRKVEVGRDVKLQPKRAGQCNYGNCENHATCTLLVIVHEFGDMSERTPPRELCEYCGDMLRERYERAAKSERSPMFGARIEFEVLEAA